MYVSRRTMIQCKDNSFWIDSLVFTVPLVSFEPADEPVVPASCALGLPLPLDSTTKL